MKNNAILHNRVLLYFIFLVSLGNLFYLTVERDITSIVIFLLVGFLTSFFSKNMLIILFIALITSSILKHGAKIRHEGLENMVDEPDDLGSAEEPAEEDLSDEFYLEKDETRKKKAATTDAEADAAAEVAAEEDVEEDIVENYEGEANASADTTIVDTKSADTKSTAPKKMKRGILTECIRTCLG